MGSTIQDRGNRAILRYGVQRAIFCPISNKLLDVRQAVYVEMVRGDQRRGTVVHAEVYDGMKGAIANGTAPDGLTIDDAETIDGRKFNW
jgi:hypothetical protein